MYVTVKPSKSQLLTKYIKTKHASYVIPFYHVCLVEQFPLKTHTHTSPTGWWFQPKKNISQIGNLPQIGMNIKKYLKPPPSQHQPSNHPTPWRSFLSESASDSVITTGLGVATGKGAGSKGESYSSEHRGTSLDETKRSRGLGYLVNWFGWVSTVDVIQCYTMSYVYTPLKLAACQLVPETWWLGDDRDVIYSKKCCCCGSDSYKMK